MFTIICPISKCPKIQQDKNLLNFDKLQCQNNGNLKIYDLLQKLKKVVRIVLYGPAISQSDCRKAGPYQLPCNNVIYIIIQIRQLYKLGCFDLTSHQTFNLTSHQIFNLTSHQTFNLTSSSEILKTMTCHIIS